MSSLFAKLKNKFLKEPPDQRWQTVKEKVRRAKRVIDLGCGSNPVAGASVGVDVYTDPKERHGGTGPVIDPESFKQKGIDFINARIDAPLPFKDREFDFAYSHHVFEHLDDPATACREMMRIARAGAIITPSYIAEILFGRPYHRWLIMDRKDMLYFFRKREFEQTPFGLPPKLDKDGKRWVMNEETNPFDMLLNDEDWYRGEHGAMPKLTEILQKYWYAHSRLLEVIFIWEDRFQWNVINGL